MQYTSFADRFLSVGLVLVASITLAACQSSPASDDLTLNDPVPQNQNQEALNGENLGNTQLQNQPPAQNQEGSGMKQLSDFDQIEATQATLTTSKGDITFELYRDQAPITTANFLNLAKDGFYDGIVFHRVIEDFMAQVGDPLTKDESKQAMWGTGGPGYAIPDEFSPDLTHDSAGIVSMANSGPNTGGSQFFITYEATPWLDGKHAVFGKVTAGMDVLEQIEIGDTILSVSYQ